MKKKSDKSLSNQLDKVFRQAMRVKKPRTNCFVCHREADYFAPKTNPYGLQVGHFISRSVYPLRWDFDNCDFVCSSCNYNHENNTLPHTQAILLEYGAEHVDLLNTKWQTSKQRAKSFTRAEKLELIEKLEAIVNDK